MQDELASLFSRNLSLEPPAQAAKALPSASSPETSSTVAQQPIQYSITQHYHHSAHLASSAPSSPQASDVGSALNIEQSMTRAATLHSLTKYGVDISKMHPAQFALYEQANASLKLRLIELWQIYSVESAEMSSSDPSPPLHHDQSEQERFTRLLFEERRKWGYADVQGSDFSRAVAAPSANGSWSPSAMADGQGRPKDDFETYPEPYIVSGYLDRLTQHRLAGIENSVIGPSGWRDHPPSYAAAIDPVFQGPGEWQRPMIRHDMTRGSKPQDVETSEDEEML